MKAHARLAEQESVRINALATVHKLRHTAHDEIERLLAFLDETDGYSTTELEPSHHSGALSGFGYQTDDQTSRDDLEGDDSELEPSLCGIGAAWLPSSEASVEDGEEEQDSEPSLGSLSSSGGSQALWALQTSGPIDAEDEHDGSEPSLCGINVSGGMDSDPECDDADSEPTLGWTVDGAIGGPNSHAADDCEMQDQAPIPRVHRIARGIIKELSVCARTDLLTGLTDRQCEVLDARLPRYVSGNTPGQRRLIR